MKKPVDRSDNLSSAWMIGVAMVLAWLGVVSASLSSIYWYH